MKHNHRRHTRNAFTLIETVTAVAVTSILLAGVGSMMIVASHAVPTRNSAPLDALDAERALAQLTEELSTALTVTDRTDTSVTFTIADRNGDALPETITYDWAGTAGAPLTRSYNGSDPVNLLPAAADFSLDFTLQEITAEGETEAVEGAEFQPVAQDVANTGVPSTSNIAIGRTLAELVQPTLPAEATAWRITQLYFQAAPSNPADGVFTVQIRPRSGSGAPSSTILESVTVNEADLVANNWHQVSFTNAGPLDPTLGAFVVFKHQSGTGNSASVRIGLFSTMTPNTTSYTSADGEVSWAANTANNTWLYLFAVPIEGDEATPTTQYRISRTHITLATSQSSLTATATMLNRPVTDND